MKELQFIALFRFIFLKSLVIFFFYNPPPSKLLIIPGINSFRECVHIIIITKNPTTGEQDLLLLLISLIGINIIYQYK